MKKVTVVVLVMLMILSFTQVTFAAGGGPPKDFKKGVFLGVDSEAGVATFLPSDSEQTMLLKLSEELKAADLPLNNKVMVVIEEKDGQIYAKKAEIMFLNLTLSKFIALLVVGFIGGLLSGFIGSGGAFVLTPSMMSLGVPGAVAVASNMCHKFPKAMVGAYKRYKYGQADLKLGLVMAVSAILGVQIGVSIQKAILKAWGNAGSNLYVSIVFVVVLVVVGIYVLYDAYKLAKRGADDTVSKLALRLQKIKIPPMMHFRTAGVTLSAWITIPVGLATGMLAATIAVGGFIGVPGMIYVVGTSAIVASATELIIAFIMGFWGSIQWALSGLVDIRLTLLILSTSLIGVQLGAMGTTYVRDYVIKLVMAAVMLIVAVSRGAQVPVYLRDIGLTTISHRTEIILSSVSFWALVAALGTAGVIISGAMIKGMRKAKAEEKEFAEREATSHGKV